MDGIKISAKYFNILKFQELMERSDETYMNLKNNQLVFMTSAGLITGDIISYRNLEVGPSHSMEEIQDDLMLKKGSLISILPLIKSKVLYEEEDIELIGGGVLLPLEKAKIYKNSINEAPVIQMDILYLHVEDVIGFSLMPRQA